MRAGPLFAQLAEDLRRQISTGTLPVGGYVPSVRRLQEIHGVSKNTVLAALKVLQEENIIAREGASRQGFRVVGVPDVAQPRDIRGAGAFVKFLLPFSYWNFAGNRLLSAIEAELGSREIGILIGNHRNDVAVENSLLRRLIEHQGETVDALIVMTASSYRNENAPLVRQIAAQVPVFLLDRRLSGFDGHTVSLNNRKLGRMVADRFLEGGRKRMGFVTGFWNASSTRDRFIGFRETLEEAGVSIASEDVICLPNAYGQAQTLDYAISEIEKQLHRWSNSPDAVLCGSDKSAAALFSFCRKRGIDVPDDVSIIGCDADEIVAPLVGTKIASFAYPFESIAEELTRLFVEHPTTTPDFWRTIELDPIFVPGETA